jgi:2-dehydro-3-deoxyphosphogluconate aldolase/(4S)-4-hydroxy-2-oxoglutarate aldolase
MTSHSEAPLALLEPARLIPLIQIDRVEDAVPLARAFVEAGLPTMEIALRTKAAPAAIRAILEKVPGAIPIAGNVMTAHDLQIARSSGARMAVSPGATDELLDAAAAQDLAFVPGIATPSELMHVLSKGFHVVKFFPAVPFGGSATLRAMAAPFPRAKFYPTGGTSEADFDDWLALENVVAVGGSWLAPREDIERRDWDHIGRRARYLVSKYSAKKAK